MKPVETPEELSLRKIRKAIAYLKGCKPGINTFQAVGRDGRAVFVQAANPEAAERVRKAFS